MHFKLSYMHVLMLACAYSFIVNAIARLHQCHTLHVCNSFSSR